MAFTTLSSWALPVWQQLQEEGLDAAALFARAGLDPSSMSVSGARYPQARMRALWRLAEEQGKPDFGLLAGQRWRSTTFHALGFAWLASGSLLDGFERLVRYGRLVADGVDYQLVARGDSWAFSLRQVLPFTVAAVDATVAALMTMVRQLAGPGLAPVKVMLPYRPHAGSVQMEAFLRCPVEYLPAADALTLVFHRPDLERALPGGNEELVLAHERIVLAHLAKLDASDLASRIRLLLMRELPAGPVSEESIARTLGLSQRTLQRRLNEQQCSFATLLETTRRELAARYLQDPNLTLADITYLLGFSDQSNFSRAFRRWHGVPPGQYREQLLSRAG